MMKVIGRGDIVLVTKIHQFGGSIRELLELIEHIRERGTTFKSLGDPLFDTTSPTGRLLSPLLAAITAFDRELLKSVGVVVFV